MRDVHRMSEGFDLHLDNRQIASFVIGSLVVLGVVFAAGVTVGRQLAQGAAGGETRPADPLAAVDAKEKAVQGTGELHVSKPEARSYQTELTKPADGAAVVGTAAKPAAAKDAKAVEAKPAKGEVPEDKAEAKPAKADEKAAEGAGDTKTDGDRKEGLAAAFDKAAAGSARPSETGGFTLQVASFPNKAEADRLVKRLTAKGLDAYHVEAEVKNKGRMFRVRVGNYPTRAEAEEGLKVFKKKSALEPFILAR